MVVAAADFYRYAEATGTPLPKSKKEEAQLAPAVNQWKKSRLVNKFTESKEDYIERNDVGLGKVAGLTAIGAAALAALNPNARRNLLNFVDKIPPNTETVTRDQSGQLVRGRPKPGTATSTNVGGIQQDLNVEPVTWDDIRESSTVQQRIKKNIFENINNKYPETDELYVDPRRIDKKESYRYSEGQKQADATTANLTPAQIEEDEQTILRIAEGEIPPGMQTPEQQAVFSRSYLENQGYVQPTAVDVAKLDDINVSQQAIENTNLNINAASNAGPQVGLDPEVTKVASSPINIQGDIITSDVEGLSKKYIVNEQDQMIYEVGAKSDIPTNTPAPGPNLSASPIGQSITNERNKVISEIKKMGIVNPKPSIIETELSRRLGKTSYDYGPAYTKLKNQIQLGVEDPRFLTDTKQDTKYVGGVELPIAVRNVFDNEATGSRQIKQPFIKEDKVTGRNLLAERAEQDFIDTKKDINTYWGEAKLDVYQQLNPLMKQTDALLEEQNMLLYSLNNQGPSRELSQRLGLVNKEIKTNQNDIAYLERRLRGIKGGQESQLEDVKKWVPTSLSDWRGEGTVVRPKPQLLRNKEIITDEGDALSALNQATQRVTDVGPEDLEIVPGGLLTGGYPKGVVNISSNVQTGTPQTPIKLASGTSIRGMGGTDLDNTYVPLIAKGTGGDFVSKYIGNKERILTRGGNILPNTPEAGTPPTIVNPQPIKRADGTYYQNPQYEEARPQDLTQPATPQGRASVELSEQLRKIYSDQNVPPEVRKLNAENLLNELGVERTATDPLVVQNTYTNLRGTPAKFNPEVEPSVTQTKVAQPLNYPAAQNQVTYVPPTESTIRSLPITPSEIEKAERMHLLNYISAAHGQIKGGARAGGTKMRNNLTPYQEPSDAMINQLIMKRRMERI
tara:strand:+ start:504 stop:3221 length:2718 start_codon:yes stop_codon:yes gene_type:complete